MFNCNQALFMALRNSFLGFPENYLEEAPWWSLYFVVPQFSVAKIFFSEISGILRIVNQ